MLRRLISLMLILLIPCWMQAAMGPAAMCPGNGEHARNDKRAVVIGQTSESTPSGHECCPPAPKKEETCGHSKADLPVCNMHSSECCQAKAPDSQLPPLKITVNGLATQLGVLSEVVAAPRGIPSNTTAAQILHSPPPLSDASSFGVVLRI